MYRYICIESKDQLDVELMMNLFSDIISFDAYEAHPSQLTLFYQDQCVTSLQEIILNVMSDTLTDLRLYVSHQFETPAQRLEHLQFIKQKLKMIPFNAYPFLSDRTICKHFLSEIDQAHKKMILKKYAQDAEMLKTIKTFLESNQHMSQAAKNLYIHRNTLIQRLDKFYAVTGFDVKMFLDAYLIYHLL